MKEKASALFSTYIIDGVQMEQTPFSALYDCLDGVGTVDMPQGPFENIVDEYMDKAPVTFSYDMDLWEDYVARILRTSFSKTKVDLSYPVIWTKNAINSVLLDTLFREGHFTLQDLLLMAKWDWNNAPAGNLAAFYDSTVSAGRYLFDLGVRLDRYFVEENRRGCFLDFSLRNRIPSRRICGDSMNPDPSDWLVYIPFENCRLHLGGSALSNVIARGCGAEMDFLDPDYFVDCYEVVREFMEDGIIVSGIPSGRGGLITAAEKFRARRGFDMDISGIMTARREVDPVKVLFAEMPGVLVQIRDADYDYVDSQLLLQEVAYFPLGHPDPQMQEIKVSTLGKDSISAILESLMRKQSSEGED